MNISVIITHWPRHIARFEYFVRSIGALMEMLAKSTKIHTFNYIAAIEAQLIASEPLLRAAVNYCRARHIKVVKNFDGPSLGRNINNALKYVEDPYILYTQDDFSFIHPPPIDLDVEYLGTHQEAGVIRYCAHVRTLEGIKRAEGSCEEDCLWELQPGVFYYWSFNPFIARTDALKTHFAPFPEVRMAETTQNRVLRKKGVKCKVLLRGRLPVPPGAVRDYTRHIGLRTSMLEKFEESRLQKQFGDDDIPLRMTRQG